jgi:hypothetical protein
VKGNFKVLFLALFSSSAFAITINAGNAPYNSIASAQGIGYQSDGELRQAAMYSLVGMYNSTHLTSQIPLNSTVQVIYDDGSKEKAIVLCRTGTACVQPVPGTAEGPGPGTGGGDGQSHPPGGGYVPPGAGAGGPPGGVVVVGPIGGGGGNQGCGGTGQIPCPHQNSVGQDF